MPGDVSPSWSFRKTIHQIKKKLNRFNNRFVFLIPAESGEKITLGISTMLNMTVFLMTVMQVFTFDLSIFLIASKESKTIQL